MPTVDIARRKTEAVAVQLVFARAHDPVPFLDSADLLFRALFGKIGKGENSRSVVEGKAQIGLTLFHRARSVRLGLGGALVDKGDLAADGEGIACKIAVGYVRRLFGHVRLVDRLKPRHIERAGGAVIELLFFLFRLFTFVNIRLRFLESFNLDIMLFCIIP